MPRRESSSSRQALYTVVLALTLCMFFYLSLRSREGTAAPTRGSRGFGTFTQQFDTVNCHHVHSAKDKCAFVHENCFDEEGIGLISYLNLYYCIFSSKARWIALICLIIWLAILFNTMAIAAGDFLCVNLGTIAHVLGMSDTLAGVTFFAFGNGSSDLFSTLAAMSSNSGSLAIGELFGAAAFITAVVVGSITIVGPFTVVRGSFGRDVVCFMIAATTSLIFVFDGELTLWECVIIIALYALYVIFVVTWHWYFETRRQRRTSTTTAKPNHQASESQELLLDDSNREIADGCYGAIAPEESGIGSGRDPSCRFEGDSAGSPNSPRTELPASTIAAETTAIWVPPIPPTFRWWPKRVELAGGRAICRESSDCRLSSAGHP